MSEIVFGTPEHVAGLSRKALEEDFQWVNDRRMELECECERLDTENAKLREQIDIWKRLAVEQEVVHVEHERASERENDELRELVRAAWKCIHSGLSCSDCRLVAGGCTLESAMRELGVEVEG